MKKLLSSIAAAFFIASNAQAAPMDLNVHNADLRSTIMMVARNAAINISVDDSVDGKISMAIFGAEPEKILDIIAKTKNLRFYNESGIFIMTAEPSTALMRSYIFPIKYGDAENFREAVVMSLSGQVTYNSKNKNRERLINTTRITENPDGSTTFSTRRNSGETGGSSENEKNYIEEEILEAEKRVLINPDTNSLIVFCTETEYERVKTLLEELDVELKQVSVEARIIAIDKDASKNLGVEWFWSSIPQTSVHRSDNMNAANAYGIVQFGRAFGNNLRNEFYFSAQINALVEKGKAKVLSRPNVTTIQGHEATINVGSAVPVPKVTTNNTATTTEIEYRDAGIILKYTPRINVDGTITAVIHTEVSTPQYVSDLKAYRFNTRSADTTVTVRDGEPMVIGGLIGAEEAKSISKIPFLGDLPILGALFRNHRRSKSESELMIFLTAHVIEGAGVGVPKNVRYSVPEGALPHEFLSAEP